MSRLVGKSNSEDQSFDSVLHFDNSSSYVVRGSDCDAASPYGLDGSSSAPLEKKKNKSSTQDENQKNFKPPETNRGFPGKILELSPVRERAEIRTDLKEGSGKEVNLDYISLTKKIWATEEEICELKEQILAPFGDVFYDKKSGHGSGFSYYKNAIQSQRGIIFAWTKQEKLESCSKFISKVKEQDEDSSDSKACESSVVRYKDFRIKRVKKHLGHSIIEEIPVPLERVDRADYEFGDFFASKDVLFQYRTRYPGELDYTKVSNSASKRPPDNARHELCWVKVKFPFVLWQEQLKDIPRPLTLKKQIQAFTDFMRDNCNLWVEVEDDGYFMVSSPDEDYSDEMLLLKDEETAKTLTFWHRLPLDKYLERLEFEDRFLDPRFGLYRMKVELQGKFFKDSNTKYHIDTCQRLVELGFKATRLDSRIRDWDRTLSYEFLNDYAHPRGLIGGFSTAKCPLWTPYRAKSTGSEGVNILESWTINIGARNKNDRFRRVYDESNNHGLLSHAHEVELKRGVADKALQALVKSQERGYDPYSWNKILVDLYVTSWCIRSQPRYISVSNRKDNGELRDSKLSPAAMVRIKNLDYDSNDFHPKWTQFVNESYRAALKEPVNNIVPVIVRAPRGGRKVMMSTKMSPDEIGARYSNFLTRSSKQSALFAMSHGYEAAHKLLDQVISVGCKRVRAIEDSEYRKQLSGQIINERYKAKTWNVERLLDDAYFHQYGPHTALAIAKSIGETFDLEVEYKGPDPLSCDWSAVIAIADDIDSRVNVTKAIAHHFSENTYRDRAASAITDLYISAKNGSYKPEYETYIENFLEAEKASQSTPIGDPHLPTTDPRHPGLVEHLGEIEDKMLAIDDGSLESFKCALEMFANDKQAMLHSVKWERHYQKMRDNKELGTMEKRSMSIDDSLKAVLERRKESNNPVIRDSVAFFDSGAVKPDSRLLSKMISVAPSIPCSPSSAWYNPEYEGQLLEDCESCIPPADWGDYESEQLELFSSENLSIDDYIDDLDDTEYGDVLYDED